jgi:hypothetical protein
MPIPLHEPCQKNDRRRPYRELRSTLKAFTGFAQAWANENGEFFSILLENPCQLARSAPTSPPFWWGLNPLSLGMVDIPGCGILNLSPETAEPLRRHR